MTERGNSEQSSDDDLLKESNVHLGRLTAPLDQITPEIRDLLRHLFVSGSDSLDKKGVSRLGFDLYMDPVMLEDIVFDCLERRREQILNPYAIVSMRGLYKVARQIKAGELDPFEVQNRQTKTAYDQLLTWVQDEELQDFMLTHGRRRRVLRAASRIISEPIGMDAFRQKLSQEVSESGKIAFEGLINRTVGRVDRQWRRHQEVDIRGFEAEEQILYILEDKRLGRMRHLARSALVDGLLILRGEAEEGRSD